MLSGHNFRGVSSSQGFHRVSRNSGNSRSKLSISDKRERHSYSYVEELQCYLANIVATWLCLYILVTYRWWVNVGYAGVRFQENERDVVPYVRSSSVPQETISFLPLSFFFVSASIDRKRSKILEILLVIHMSISWKYNRKQETKWKKEQFIFVVINSCWIMW